MTGAEVAKTVAICNCKGGVGKTTTAICLAECLRGAGLRVLLVDLDQQHNSTRQYGAETEGVYTAFDLLVSRDAPAAECVQRTDRGDIIAGDDCMSIVEERMVGLYNREYMLLDGLAQVAGDYDYIVIDCPPGREAATRNALVAADEVIVPMLPDGFSRDGCETLMEQIAAIRANPRLNPDLRVAGLLLTQHRARRVLSRRDDAELPALAERYGTRLYGTRIRDCEAVRRAQSELVPLFAYAPDCPAARDYRDFAREYLADAG